MGDELVICRSGFTYAEQPVFLYWNGARLSVEQIQAEWRTPDGKKFRIRTRDGQDFELFYSEPLDMWQVHPL